MAEAFNDATSDSGTGLFLTLSCMLISRARYHASLDSALDRAETLVRSTPSDHPNYPRRAELRDQLIATLKTKGGPEAEMAPDANLGASPGPLSAILCGATTHFERVVFVVWTHTQRKFASDVARTRSLSNWGHRVINLKSPRVLQHVIQYVRTLAAAQVSDEAHCAWILGCLYTVLAEIMVEEEQIEFAIQQVELAKLDGVAEAWILASTSENLRSLYHLRHNLCKDPESLDRAIEAADIAARMTPPDDDQRSYRLHSLTELLMKRLIFKREDGPGYNSDLDRLIKIMSDVVETSPVKNDDATQHLNESQDALRNSEQWISKIRTLAALHLMRN